MLDRCVLNGQAAVICSAPKDTALHVTIWNMPEVRDAVAGTTVYISTNKSHATPNYGMPIPPNGFQFPIWLEPGETLWGIAYDEALLGVSTRPGV